MGPFALIGRAEADLRRFDTVLRSFGYYDAGIDIRIAGLALDDPGLLPLLEGLAPSPPVAVQVTLTPGPLYHLGLVRLDGEVPPEVRAAFDLQPGAPARAAEVLAAGEAVLRALREDSFPLAQVPPPDAVVDHDTRTMDVVYLAEPGPRLALGAVSITGLERLQEGYVLRRLGLSPGRALSARRAWRRRGGTCSPAGCSPGRGSPQGPSPTPRGACP